MKVLFGSVMILLGSLAVSERAAASTATEYTSFYMRLAGDNGEFGFNSLHDYDPVDQTLSATSFFRIKTKGVADPHGHKRFGFSGWAGTLDFLLDESRPLPRGRVQGALDRSGFFIEGSEDDKLLFDFDGSWLCTGRCEFAVRVTGTEDFVPSGTFLTSGTYSISSVPLSASGAFLGSALLGFFGWAVARAPAMKTGVAA